MFSDLSIVQKIAVWALPVLLAITLHEVAHGWVARWLGDNTAYAQGRLSLNPLAHIDPVGTLLVPGLLLLVGGFLFGWAKPVPVNFRNLKNPKRDMAIVAVAGPLTNLAMAVGWVVLLRISLAMPDQEGLWLGLRYMAVAGVSINLALMVLNLIPLPPLDGGRVAVGLLPMNAAVALSRLEPYGMIILILLLATGVLGKIMGPPMMIAQALLFGLVGLR
ncbi:MAG: site-2 protease family protein [Pseudomonadota bacterium]